MSKYTWAENGVTVVTGYIREEDALFLTVYAENGEIIWSDLEDLEAGSSLTAAYAEIVMKTLGLTVPDGFSHRLELDAASEQRGGRGSTFHFETVPDLLFGNHL